MTDSAVWAAGVTAIVAAALSPLLIVSWLARADHYVGALLALVVYLAVYMWALSPRKFG